MRILNCIHSLNPSIGGPARVGQAILARSRPAGSCGGGGFARSTRRLLGWANFQARAHALGPGRGSYGYAPRFVPWLKERRAGYDAVVVHGIWQYHSFGVWRALHGTPIPYFVFPHGMLDPWFNHTYRLKHLKKLLYWPWAEYRVLRDATAVLFTGEEERRLARESFRLYRCREAVVNFGTAAPEVDLPRAQEAFWNAFPQLRAKKFLLFLGRLHEKKGCEELIRAFAALHHSGPGGEDLHLVLAGPCANETYLRHLQRLTTELMRGENAPPVTFTGMLTGNPKWGAFAASEAFVLPSHQENFGIAVVEALACGRPVLISNKVNIWREIVEPTVAVTPMKMISPAPNACSPAGSPPRPRSGAG